VTGYFVLDNDWIEGDSNRIAPNSVWVLRFVSVGDNEREYYLGAGLSDDVTFRLAHNKDLLIHSVTDFYPTTHEEVSNEFFDVAYVVEGDAQLFNDQIHVVVRLFDMRRNEYVWRNNYDESIAEYIEDEGSLVSSIAQDIHNSVME
jgi:TolB-like protein